MKKEIKLLLLIFLITFSTRIYFAYQTPHFSDDAYFHLRQINHIREHGLPMTYDELSYGGRSLINPPLFHYVMAFFDLFLPIQFIAKILPNLFGASSLIAVFLIAMHITKSKMASLFAAFISAFAPLFFSQTINNVSPFSLFIPVLFFASYCLMRIQDHKSYITAFVILSFALPLIHHIAFLFLVGRLFYLLLTTIQHLAPSKAEVEVVLFAVFSIFWLQFLIYKNAFLEHGLYVIWQNIPAEILGNYFSDVNLGSAIYQIGIIPFVFGILVMGHQIFKKKNKSTYLFFGYALATGLLLWLKLIPFEPGIMLLGIILAILFSQFFQTFIIYLDNTKVHHLKLPIIILFLVLFGLSSIVPSLIGANRGVSDALTEEDYLALSWMKTHTKDNPLVLASLSDSYAVEALANRKTIANPNFLLVDNINQRFSDFRTLFTTSYETDAVRLLTKYDIRYIFLSKRALTDFNIQSLSYLDNAKCFDRIEEQFPIYEVLCEIQ